MSLHNTALQLYLYAKIKPEIWDAIIPMGPFYSKGTRKIVAGQLLKAISKLLKNEHHSQEAYRLGSEIYAAGNKSMSYDDDYILCPPFWPWPWPWPGPLDVVDLNPQPQPPEYYAGIFELVALSLEDKSLSGRVQNLAGSILTTQG